MTTVHPPTYVVGITGASGAAYAVRLLDVLLARPCRVMLSISPAAVAVIRQELGRKVDLDDFHSDALFEPARPWLGNLDYFHHQDLMAPMASGSALSDGMVICPCSGGTLSAVAHAQSNNLIQRAAEVHLKERRKLILVPRETPLSLPQIENMRQATMAGAVVLPASPGFYHRPQTLDDLVDFVVARICDHLELDNDLSSRWGDGN